MPHMQHRSDTSCASSRTSLLQLPPEITLNILRHLLLNKEPLDGISVKGHPKCEYHHDRLHKNCWEYEKCRNFRFSPQVLQTCKRLCQEGTAILYHENSIRLHVFHDRWTDYVFMEDDVVNPLDLDLELGDEFSKFEIKLHVLQIEGPDFGIEPMHNLIQEIGKLCQIIDYYIDVSSKHLTINVSVTKLSDPYADMDSDSGVEATGAADAKDDNESENADDGDKDDPSVLKYLTTFQVLRCSTLNVVLDGETIANPPEWATIMTSGDDVLDLYDIFKRTKDFSRDHVAGYQILEKLMTALVEWNLDDMLRTRGEAVERGKRAFEERKRRFKEELAQCLGDD